MPSEVIGFKECGERRGRGLLDRRVFEFPVRHAHGHCTGQAVRDAVRGIARTLEYALDADAAGKPFVELYQLLIERSDRFHEVAESCR